MHPLKRVVDGRARALALSEIAFGMGLLGGCASLLPLEKPAQQATKGALEGAQEGLQPQVVAELTRNVTAGVLRGLADEANNPEELRRMRIVVRALVQEVVAGAAGASGTAGLDPARLVANLRGPAGALSRQVGYELASGIADALRERMSKPGLGDGLAGGAEAVGAQVAQGLVRGGAIGLSETLPCPSGDRAQCLQDSIRALSRASAAGASDAVAKKTSPWPFIATFALGGFLTLLSVGALRAATRRQTPPQPPGAPAPVEPRLGESSRPAGSPSGAPQPA